jgi:pyridoxal phosphate enzyme (YggS family)
MKQILADNLKRIHDRITRACHRARRDPSEVKLIAVTKYVEPEVVRALIELGQLDIGENKVQELTHRAALGQEWFPRRPYEKTQTATAPAPRWHMVGHLQRNKVRALLPWVSLIHSVDSLRLAEELDSESEKIARKTDILLEINASGEAAKQGVAVAAATHLAEQISTLTNLNLRGLMAMGPLTQEAEPIRRAFERVRELFDEMITVRVCGPNFRELSLGMSNDFEHGIEFGATCVRIGSALFEGLQLSPERLAADADATVT